MTAQVPLTLITPVRNAENYFQHALESVAAQTCKDFEYIVLDGASTDATPALIEQYRSVISYTHSRPDKGGVDAFNQGIEMARGEYIAFLSADDWIEPDAVECIVAQARLHPSTDIISFGLMEWEQQQKGSLAPDAVYLDPDDGEFGIENAVYCPCISRCFRRSLYLRYGLLRPEEYGHFADRELQLRFALHLPKKTVIPKVLYHFRKHSASSTGNAAAATIIGSMECNMAIAEQYLSKPCSAVQKKALLEWYGFAWVRAVFFLLRSGRVVSAVTIGVRGMLRHPFACIRKLLSPVMPEKYRSRKP